MRILVVSTTVRRSWSDLAADAAQRADPGAEVLRVWADGRMVVDPPRPGVELSAWPVGGLRYADAVLAAGERAAAWLGLPWWVPEVAGAGPVAVLDDQVLLGAGLDDLVARAGSAATAVVRARRVTGGLAWGGGLPGLVVLPHGVAAAGDLLAWWRERAGDLLRCPTADVGAPDRALWASLPTGSGVVAVTAPGWRLSAATASEVRLDADDPAGGTGAGTEVEGPTVGGAPVGAVDLGGFDPARPWWFAAEDGERVPLVGRPALRALLRDTVDQLRARGWSPERPLAPVPGMVVDDALRRWYRSLLAAGPDLPPNPLVAGQVAPFLDLLAARGRGESGGTVEADLVLERRPDVRDAFPSGTRAGREGLVRWMWTHGLRERAVSAAALPDLPLAAVSEAPGRGRPHGVNVIGYLDGDLGLGVAARRMVDALDAAGVPCATMTYGRTSSRRRSDGGSGAVGAGRFDTNLLVITPDQLPLFVRDEGPGVLAGRRNIGLWFWETDVLPSGSMGSYDLLDEVWAPTEYLRAVFDRPGRVPVSHVPVPLTFADPGEVDRSEVGLDDRFTVLFSFDFLSVADRKNPEGLIEAYERAFPEPDGVRLVLKSINGELFPERLARLEDRAADRPDVEIRDEYVSARDRLALVAAADCYASLHRSEGLGLTMAEAMAVGTPVVATAYSGNLDFMDDSCALLVPAREVLIGPGHHYPPEGHWADPDLDVAAGHLRRLRAEPDLRRRLADAGRRRIAAHGLDAAAAAVRAALASSARVEGPVR